MEKVFGRRIGNGAGKYKFVTYCADCGVDSEMAQSSHMRRATSLGRKIQSSLSVVLSRLGRAIVMPVVVDAFPVVERGAEPLVSVTEVIATTRDKPTVQINSMDVAVNCKYVSPISMSSTRQSVACATSVPSDIAVCESAPGEKAIGIPVLKPIRKPPDKDLVIDMFSKSETSELGHAQVQLQRHCPTLPSPSDLINIDVVQRIVITDDGTVTFVPQLLFSNDGRYIDGPNRSSRTHKFVTMSRRGLVDAV